jgi:ubiquinone/menaquinone biosynthesis C-methylase UbiE
MDDQKEHFERREGKIVAEWNRILREEWYSREEPEEIIVDFVSRLKGTTKKLRVLDIGCGAGRHVVYMANQGFEVHGIDVSEVGLNSTRARLKSRRLKGNLVKCDMKMLPYIDSCFAAVVSLHTVYHQRLNGIQKTILEISRVLRKKGFLLVNFLSKRTFSYGKGLEVEENTFMEQEGLEKGVLHYFVNKKEVERLFKGFKILDLRISEKIVEGKPRSRWVLIATV